MSYLLYFNDTIDIVIQAVAMEWTKARTCSSEDKRLRRWKNVEILSKSKCKIEETHWINDECIARLF